MVGKLPEPFVRKLVEKANMTAPFLSNSMDSVRRVMAQGDVVFGIWQDETEPYGVGIHCIKGQNLLREVIATDKGKQVSIIAIPCVSAEQAIALERAEGDKIN